jgi:hypothetical protein
MASKMLGVRTIVSTVKLNIRRMLPPDPVAKVTFTWDTLTPSSLATRFWISPVAEQESSGRSGSIKENFT